MSLQCNQYYLHKTLYYPGIIIFKSPLLHLINISDLECKYVQLLQSFRQQYQKKIKISKSAQICPW